jgi:hypothetical protein
VDQVGGADDGELLAGAEGVVLRVAAAHIEHGRVGKRLRVDGVGEVSRRYSHLRRSGRRWRRRCRAAPGRPPRGHRDHVQPQRTYAAPCQLRISEPQVEHMAPGGAPKRARIAAPAARAHPEGCDPAPVQPHGERRPAGAASSLGPHGQARDRLGAHDLAHPFPPDQLEGTSSACPSVPDDLGAAIGPAQLEGHGVRCRRGAERAQGYEQGEPQPHRARSVGPRGASRCCRSSRAESGGSARRRTPSAAPS